MVCPISHLDWLHLLWSICEKSSRRYVYKQHGVHGRHHCTDNQLVDCTDWSSHPSLRWEKSIKSVTFTMPIRNNTKKATNSSFGLFLFAIHFVPCGWPVKCMVPMVHIFAKEDWKWSADQMLSNDTMDECYELIQACIQGTDLFSMQFYWWMIVQLLNATVVFTQLANMLLQIFTANPEIAGEKWIYALFKGLISTGGFITSSLVIYWIRHPSRQVTDAVQNLKGRPEGYLHSKWLNCNLERKRSASRFCG